MSKRKESKGVSKTPEDIINDIRQACASLGWFIGMNESKSSVSGLVIGMEDFVEDTLDQLDDADEYSIYDAGSVNVGLQ